MLGDRLPSYLMHWEIARLLALITAPSHFLKSQEAVNIARGLGYKYPEHFQRRTQAVAMPMCYTMAWNARSSPQLYCGPQRNLGHRLSEGQCKTLPASTGLKFNELIGCTGAAFELWGVGICRVLSSHGWVSLASLCSSSCVLTGLNGLGGHIHLTISWGAEKEQVSYRKRPNGLSHCTFVCQLPWAQDGDTLI